MMEALFSVVVPVYNSSKVVDETIESIINQTYKNFELILVDDGSTDDSGLKCDFWAQKDTRVRVIHKKNGGLSSARNAGLEIAVGKYICFVDADDWLLSNALDVFNKRIADFPDADFIKTNYQVKTVNGVVNTKFAILRAPYENKLIRGGEIFK